MNVNLYLPDEIGERAKAAELPLSQLLRSAVLNELERRQAVEQTLQHSRVYEVALENDEGGQFIGRIEGTMIADDEDVQVYLTDDERVIVVDGRRQKHFEVQDLEELRDWLTGDAYVGALTAMGEKPVIDL